MGWKHYHFAPGNTQNSVIIGVKVIFQERFSKDPHYPPPPPPEKQRTANDKSILLITESV